MSPFFRVPGFDSQRAMGSALSERRFKFLRRLL